MDDHMIRAAAIQAVATLVSGTDEAKAALQDLSAAPVCYGGGTHFENAVKAIEDFIRDGWRTLKEDELLSTSALWPDLEDGT